MSKTTPLIELQVYFRDTNYLPPRCILDNPQLIAKLCEIIKTLSTLINDNEGEKIIDEFIKKSVKDLKGDVKDAFHLELIKFKDENYIKDLARIRIK